MPNRLASASSPYLLQHADNPVDWYEWSEEALAAAEDRDVPIFLSVGYSACHWCHVMAHESFEDRATAAYMNEHFVNIKVDREERPDIDRIYMDAVQAMTGQGGWPMSVFLTPDGRPVMAGTYFPPQDIHGRPSFGRVIEAVTDAWTQRREAVHEQADRLTAAVRQFLPPAEDALDSSIVIRAIESIAGTFDDLHGGFGGAPKFPQAPNLELLLRYQAMNPEGPDAPTIARILTTTLDRMAAGGIYDHLGGGFARYTVDRIWLVPHFEKMLYDNALLARTYLRAWQLFGTPRYREVVEETLDYLMRDMQDPGGGLHSAEDADSEGEEGKFYVFTRAEFDAILGERAALFAQLYGVTDAGNFEGANVLHIAVAPAEVAANAKLGDDEWQEVRARGDAALLAARNTRVRPGKDDKVITAWNGLALRAFAEAGAVLGSDRYLAAAEAIARFCLNDLTRADGRVLRSVRNGRGSVPGFCEDYGALAVGLLSLYQATGNEEWFESGRTIAVAMVDLFSAQNETGFYATGSDAETLISRPKNYMDNPSPSDNSLAAEALQMLFALTGDSDVRPYVDSVFAGAGRLLDQHPAAVGHLLAVLAVDRPREVAVVGSTSARSELTSVIWETFRPDVVLAQGPGKKTSVPLLMDRSSGPQGLAYVCQDFVCALPVDSPAALRRQLGP